MFCCESIVCFGGICMDTELWKFRNVILIELGGGCDTGHLDMVKFLLEEGANLEHKTDEMHTALMEASMDGHVDVARYLLDRGAQVIDGIVTRFEL